MKIKEITYLRIKNLGNYENEKLEVTAQLSDKENPEKAFKKLKTCTEYQLDIIDKNEVIEELENIDDIDVSDKDFKRFKMLELN